MKPSCSSRISNKPNGSDVMGSSGFCEFIRVPQIFPWRANLLQSLAPTLIKLTYLWYSNDLEDSDQHAQVCLIRVRAKLCRSGPDLRMPGLCDRIRFERLLFVLLTGSCVNDVPHKDRKHFMSHRKSHTVSALGLCAVLVLTRAGLVIGHTGHFPGGLTHLRGRQKVFFIFFYFFTITQGQRAASGRLVCLLYWQSKPPNHNAL